MVCHCMLLTMNVEVIVVLSEIQGMHGCDGACIVWVGTRVHVYTTMSTCMHGYIPWVYVCMDIKLYNNFL